MYRCTRARVGDRFERVSERKRHSRPQSGGSLADWRTVYARTRSALRFHCPPVPDRERSASWGERQREREIQPRRCGESLEASVEWSARVEWNRVCFSFFPTCRCAPRRVAYVLYRWCARGIRRVAPVGHRRSTPLRLFFTGSRGSDLP